MMGLFSKVFKGKPDESLYASPEASERVDSQPAPPDPSMRVDIGVPAGYKQHSIFFFDVETPNPKSNRICQIGMIETDFEGKELRRLSTLVNPECDFSPINTSIHGICKEHVVDAPTFPQVWRNFFQVQPSELILVAHNANFDITVLEKTLMFYEIDLPTIMFADTLYMARTLSLPSAKLNLVCNELGIELARHHDAICDAEACMYVYWQLYDGSHDFSPRYRHYIDGRSLAAYEAPERELCDSSKAFNHFKDVAADVISDGKVTTEEAMLLLELIHDDAELSSDISARKVLKILQVCLADGHISEDESTELMSLLSRIVHPEDCSSGEFDGIDGKSFCLTGNFSHGTRGQVEEFITHNGGNVLKGVTKKCDYVVIGDLGSEMYSMGSYGGKVKKAMEWQEKGVPIQIIKEDDLFGEG